MSSFIGISERIYHLYFWHTGSLCILSEPYTIILFWTLYVE